MGLETDSVLPFAVVAGIVRDSFSPSVLLILGFANLFADRFSVAIGNNSLQGQN